jgi:hypothetical protein
LRIGRVVQADVEEASVSAYVQEETSPWTWLRLMSGVRADYFGFDVDDPLEALAPDAPKTSGTAHDSIVSLKTNAILTPWESTDFYLNYGIRYFF